jgi:hypothetical protein
MAADNPHQRGDVVAVVPTSTYVLPLRVTKDRAEDLQIESFAHALGLAVGEHVRWERGSDQDAPDGTITVGGKRMEIELTALTAGALRAERQRLSDVAELVRDEIAGMADLSAALSGWTVNLSDAADRPMPTKSGAPTTAARIISLLAMRFAPSPPRDNGARRPQFRTNSKAPGASTAPRMMLAALSTESKSSWSATILPIRVS